jgi:hypothetical protein
MQNREQEIRQLTYRLWQADGEPAGLDVDHWRRAEEIWADGEGPAPGMSSEPFGEPVEPTLAVINQAPPTGLDDEAERTVAPRRMRKK